MVCAIVLLTDYDDARFDIMFNVSALALLGNAVHGFVTAPPEHMRLYMFESALLFVFGQSFFPARFGTLFKYGVLGAAGASAAFIHAGADGGMAAVPLPMLLLTTAGLALLCQFATYSREILVRRNYRETSLAEEIRSLAVVLERNAQDASEAKSRFLSNAAHELRTPLNAVGGYSVLALRGADADDLTGTARSKFEEIRTLSRRLGRMSEAVLGFAEDENATLSDAPPETFEMAALDELVGNARTAGTACRSDFAAASGVHGLLVRDAATFAVIIENLIAAIAAGDDPAGVAVTSAFAPEGDLVLEFAAEPAPCADGRARRDGHPLHAIAADAGDDTLGLTRFLCGRLGLTLETRIDGRRVGLARLTVPVDDVVVGARSAVRAAAS
jgi:signal transduction histidine kinase